MWWEALLSALPAFFLYTARIAGAVVATPGLSQSTIPTQFKVALVLLIGFALHVALGPGAWAGADPWLAAVALPLEFLVGLTLGFAVRLLFAAIELAGEFTAFQMGYAAAAAFDPTMGAVSSPPTRLLFMFALMLFFTIDGHHYVILAIADSYAVVPVGGAGLSSINAEAFLDLTYGLFRTALRMALPLIIVMLMINVVLGLMVRFLPQVNVFMIGFILTITFGLTIMAELMPSFGTFIVAMLESTQTILPQLLRPQT